LSNNIANVNTPGYSRQQSSQTTNASNQFGGVFIGTGTTLADVRRVYNEYLDTAYQNSTALSSDANAYLDQISSVDKCCRTKPQPVLGAQFLLCDPANRVVEPQRSVGPAIAGQQCPNPDQSLQFDLHAVDPAERDHQQSVSTMSDQVNQLTSSIASLNKQIFQVQGASGNAPATC